MSFACADQQVLQNIVGRLDFRSAVTLVILCGVRKLLHLRSSLFDSVWLDTQDALTAFFQIRQSAPDIFLHVHNLYITFEPPLDTLKLLQMSNMPRDLRKACATHYNVALDLTHDHPTLQSLRHLVCKNLQLSNVLDLQNLTLLEAFQIETLSTESIHAVRQAEGDAEQKVSLPSMEQLCVEKLRISQDVLSCISVPAPFLKKLQLDFSIFQNVEKYAKKTFVLPSLESLSMNMVLDVPLLFALLNSIDMLGKLAKFAISFVTVRGARAFFESASQVPGFDPKCLKVAVTPLTPDAPSNKGDPDKYTISWLPPSLEQFHLRVRPSCFKVGSLDSFPNLRRLVTMDNEFVKNEKNKWWQLLTAIDEGESFTDVLRRSMLLQKLYFKPHCSTRYITTGFVQRLFELDNMNTTLSIFDLVADQWCWWHCLDGIMVDHIMQALPVDKFRSSTLQRFRLALCHRLEFFGAANGWGSHAILEWMETKKAEFDVQLWDAMCKILCWMLVIDKSLPKDKLVLLKRQLGYNPKHLDSTIVHAFGYTLRDINAYISEQEFVEMLTMAKSPSLAKARIGGTQNSAWYDHHPLWRNAVVLINAIAKHNDRYKDVTLTSLSNWWSSLYASGVDAKITRNTIHVLGKTVIIHSLDDLKQKLPTLLERL